MTMEFTRKKTGEKNFSTGPGGGNYTYKLLRYTRKYSVKKYSCQGKIKKISKKYQNNW
jgi:hypothetical protein